MQKYLITALLLIPAVFPAALCPPLYGQAVDAEPVEQVNVNAQQDISLWNVVQSGGNVGYLILLMSLAALALVIRNFISLQRPRLLPDHLVGDLEELLEKNDYEQARQMCLNHSSYLAHVIGAGLTQIGSMFGFFDMQNAMQETSEREISKLYRKLEYLSFIASTAPMLGLLGTVLGMIKAFNEISLSEGAAQPSQLAGGISEALVTTCLGLIVAIPTMFFVAFFRNRIDNTISEAEVIVEKLMGRFRREAVK